MTNDELTPYEKKAFESLPRERVPSAFLEERIVKALKQRGVLYSQESPRLIRITGWRIAGAVAACAAFVICGFALGYWASARPVYVSQTVVPGVEREPAALSVQEAGTGYVLALESLAAHSDSTQSEEMRQGREVALNTMYTAADQMLRIVPKEVLARCIAEAIATAGNETAGTPSDGTSPRVIKF